MLTHSFPRNPGILDQVGSSPQLTRDSCKRGHPLGLQRLLDVPLDVEPEPRAEDLPKKMLISI
jgi:hypothetical protein